MDDKLEGKYQNVIRRLEDDLLAADSREQFYANTLHDYSKRIKQLQMSAVGMKCESCGGDSRVMSTRTSGVNNAIHRRRKCNLCNHRWTTIETNADFIKVLLRQAKETK